MKKIITLALAILMIFAMSVSAFAEEVLVDNYDKDSDDVNDTDLEHSGNVTVTLPTDNSTGESTIVKVYYVCLDWAALEFEYTFDAATSGGQVRWDPLTHTYKDETGNNVTGSWGANKTITVYNHSNDDVTATATATTTLVNNLRAGVSTTENATAAGDTATFDLGAATANPTAGANVNWNDTTLTPNNVFYVSVHGTPTDLEFTNPTIGTITVTITHT